MTHQKWCIVQQNPDNLDELIESNDVNELLLAIDDVIVLNMDENDEPDELGINCYAGWWT